MRSVSAGRRPAITSSSSSSFGSVASARATSSRLRSGNVSVEATCSRLPCRSSCSSTSRARRRAAGDIGSVQQRADNDVVLDGERRERPHDLERPSDAAPADRVGRQTVDALAREADRALVRRELRRRSC